MGPTESELPVDHRHYAHMISPPTGMFLGGGRKLENWKKDMHTERHADLQSDSELRIELEALQRSGCL